LRDVAHILRDSFVHNQYQYRGMQQRGSQSVFMAYVMTVAVTAWQSENWQTPFDRHPAAGKLPTGLGVDGTKL